MAYVSLDEAVQIVERRTGVDITVPQLIRLAAMGRFLLCVLLNCRCYSPSARLRNEAADLAKHGRLTDVDPSGKGAVEAATVEAYGAFVIPPRHAFDFQTDDEVLISVVSSPDGNDTFCPSVRRRRDQLQALLPHLEDLISSINEAKEQSSGQAATNPPASPPEQLPRAKLQRKALIEKHLRKWESIDRDLKDAASNGLSGVAKLGGGFWDEEAALLWARERGKIRADESEALRSVLHRLGG